MFRTLSLAAAAAVFPLSALACAGFEIHDGYARSSTIMSQSGAAFMVIHNHGSEDCHIASARSTVSEVTELHTHIEDDQGVMRMVEVEEGFALPVDGEVIMERGGHHVMFLGLTRPLADGDAVDITFVFADGSEETVEVVVDNERQPASHGHSHSHSHSHSHGD